MTAIIRLANASDAEAIHAIYAPIVQNTIISFETETPTIDEMQERIVTTTARFPWLVCLCEGDCLGYAYASAHRTRAAYQWSVDVSVYISEKRRRTGVGRALYVVLSTQRIESRTLAADMAGEQRQMDQRHGVVGAVRMLGNTQRPINRRVLRSRVHSGRLNDQVAIDPGNCLGVFGSELLHGFGELIEALGAPVDEILIVKPFLEDDM